MKACHVLLAEEISIRWSKIMHLFYAESKRFLLVFLSDCRTVVVGQQVVGLIMVLARSYARYCYTHESSAVGRGMGLRSTRS